MKTNETKKQLASMRDDLWQLRDEVRLKVHLAGMDLKDELATLEPQIDAFERRAELVTGEVGAELHESWEHVKKALEKLRAEVSSRV